MQPNDFLEYLCGLGLAQRDKTYVRVPHPHYPYQNSGYVTKRTEFKEEGIYYYIQLDIVLEDDKIGVRNPDGKKMPVTILDSLFAFLKKYRYWQPYGNMFTSRSATGISNSPYRAGHLGPSINIDELMVILSAICPIGPGSPLAFAMALNNLKDIIVEKRRSVEPPKQREEIIEKQSREDNKSPARDSVSIPNEISILPPQKKEENRPITERIENVSSDTVRVNQQVSSSPKYIKGTYPANSIEYIDVKIRISKYDVDYEHIIRATRADTMYNYVDGKYDLYHKGDTVKKTSFRVKGSNYLKETETIKHYRPGNAEN